MINARKLLNLSAILTPIISANSCLLKEGFEIQRLSLAFLGSYNLLRRQEREREERKKFIEDGEKILAFSKENKVNKVNLRGSQFL